MRFFSNCNICIFIGLLVLLSSCVSMGKISIQVSVPPKREIPNDIQSITLMNRSMTSAFSDLDQDSLESLFIKKKLSLDNIFLDSLAADTTLQAIGNAMYESGRFEVAIPLRRNLPNHNSSYLNQSPSLTLAQARQICDEFKTDAVLCLENFYEKINTSFHVETRSGMEGVLKEYGAYVQVAYHSNWKLYQPLEKLMVAKFEVKDTIFWECKDNTLQQTYECLPTIKEALMTAAVENGKNLATYISPEWKTEERSYYITNNQNADKAVNLLNMNDWNGAREIWEKFASSTSPGLRSKIEFNLALAAEMNGDMKEAFDWANKSLRSRYSKVTEDYIKILNSRL